MPLIASAKKKMRKDVKRTAHNDAIWQNIKSLIKNQRRTPSEKSLQDLQSALDKAVKTNLIHANKAARLKSRLSKGNSSAGTTKKASKKKTPVKKVNKKK